MAEVTTVSEGNAQGIQQEWNRVVEEFLRRTLLAEEEEKSQDNSQNKQGEKPNQTNKQSPEKKQDLKAKVKESQSDFRIEISEGNQLKYGISYLENPSPQPGLPPTRIGIPKNDLDYESLGKLSLLKNTPVGQQLPGLANIRIDKVIESPLGQQRIPLIQTDETGKVVVNQFQEKPNYRQVSGAEVVQKGLSQLNESEEKNYLLNLVDFLQQERQKQLSQIQKLEEANQEQRQILEKYQQVLSGRLEEPRNPQWWQKLSASGQELWQDFKKQWTNQRQTQESAKTIETLFNRQVAPGGKVYEGQGYRIIRDENRYLLQDKQGNNLLVFQTKPFGGVKVETNQLNPQQFQEIIQLRQQLRSEKQLKGNFASTEMMQQGRMERLNNILQGLTRMVQQTGNPINHEGNLYRTQVDASGNVKISAKDGRGIILLRDKESWVSRMTDNDISAYEKMLQTTKTQQVQSNQKTINQPPNVQEVSGKRRRR